jgi:hypothetical protein
MFAFHTDALERVALEQRRAVDVTHGASPTQDLLEQLDVGLHRPLTDGWRYLFIAVPNAALLATRLVLLHVVPRERVHGACVADRRPHDVEPYTCFLLTLRVVVEEHGTFLDEAVAQPA